jgi:hypothetical protein
MTYYRYGKPMKFNVARVLFAGKTSVDTRNQDSNFLIELSMTHVSDKNVHIAGNGTCGKENSPISCILGVDIDAFRRLQPLHP